MLTPHPIEAAMSFSRRTPATATIRRSRLLAVLALLVLLGVAAQARAAGPSRVVFVAGKARHCQAEACHQLDVVRSISPHGRHPRTLTEIREVAETASADDGTVAVLSTNHAGGGANAGSFVQVYLIHPDGRRSTVFSHRLERFSATGLAISGDGRTLALGGHFSEKEPGKPSKIWILNADGSGMRELTTGPGSDRMPALSADGSEVAFVRQLPDGTPAGRDPELYTVPAAGGEPRRLTDNAVEDANPVWSPDGRRIAFGEVTHANQGSVQIVAADGSGQRRVAGTGREYPDPDFSPSGRSLVFVGQVAGGRAWDDALYTVRASGADHRLLSRRFADPGLPQWTAAGPRRP